MKKIICMILAVICMLPCFAACNNTNGNGVDETKSQLNIGFFNAGFGDAWIEEAKTEFENYYAGTSFEEDKQGVEIVLDKKKDEFTVGALVPTMPNYENTLYFLDQFELDNYYGNGLLADITSIVTEKVYDDDGNFAKDTGNTATKSIVDFYYDGYAEKSMIDGEHYVVPYRYSVDGIIYDADLFNEKGFYFFANGQIGAKQADIDSENCSTGPDGKMGTVDDGMPNTWNDFITLLDYMVAKNVTPFTWGDTDYPKWKAFAQIWANYEGANDFELNYTFNGTDSQFGQITDDNYVQLLEQNGRKAAIKAFKDFTSKITYYSENATTNSFTEAQFEYIWSAKTNKRIAMFFDGGYWESEGRLTFDEMAKSNANYGYGKRDFRLLPVPNFVDVEEVPDQTKQNDDRVIFGYGSQSAICIAAKNTCENYDVQYELAKLFIQFVQRRDQLVDFTKNTGGGFRLAKFEATEQEVSSYTKFGQSIYNQIAEGATVLTNIDVSAVRSANPNKYNESNWIFYIKPTYAEPLSYFLNNPTKTVTDCYEQCLADMKAKFE